MLIKWLKLCATSTSNMLNSPKLYNYIDNCIPIGLNRWSWQAQKRPILESWPKCLEFPVFVVICSHISSVSDYKKVFI